MGTPERVTLPRSPWTQEEIDAFNQTAADFKAKSDAVIEPAIARRVAIEAEAAAEIETSKIAATIPATADGISE